LIVIGEGIKKEIFIITTNLDEIYEKLKEKKELDQLKEEVKRYKNIDKFIQKGVTNGTHIN
jgi:hypothetical protein